MKQWTRLIVVIPLLAVLSFSQEKLPESPSAAPRAFAPQSTASNRGSQQAQGSDRSIPGVSHLSRKDAETIALRNNPSISVARLTALAAQQVTREAKSALWPTAVANLTAVDAHDDSRIAAGGLNNPIIFARAAAGATVSQLITDFGRTSNLVASARLGAKADDQNMLATKEQILLAVDQAFYDVLQSQAVLKVAEQTVNARQLLSDQVAALTQSKLKSDLDLSFANVNLSQAKLFQLDAQNNSQSALSTLSAILGYPGLQNVDVVDDSEPLTAPTGTVDDSIAQALSHRPDLLALEFEGESQVKLKKAERDRLFPTISALGAIGDTPVRDDRLSNWYGAVGVNVQIPLFNGFLYAARTQEANLRAQATHQRLLDLRNRAARDVRKAWLGANTAYQRLTVAAELLDQTNRALDLAQTRYKLGLGSIVELSQAQLQQTQAQIGNSQAGYEYRLALRVLQFEEGSL